jgi:hypothetical protein
MKKIPLFIAVIILLLSCSSGLSVSEKEALAVHLSVVEKFESDYLTKLNAVKSRNEFINIFNQTRMEVRKLIDEKEALKKQYPGLRNYRVNIRRLPEEFHNSYYRILEIRRDISKAEYVLMIRYKTEELDTPGVFILGNSIKKSVFIE